MCVSCVRWCAHARAARSTHGQSWRHATPDKHFCCRRSVVVRMPRLRVTHSSVPDTDQVWCELRILFDWFRNFTSRRFLHKTNFLSDNRNLSCKLTKCFKNILLPITSLIYWISFHFLWPCHSKECGKCSECMADVTVLHSSKVSFNIVDL